MKKLIKCIIILFIGLVVIPLPIHRTLNAYEYVVGEPSYREEVTLNIKSWYHLNLFGTDTFEGTLTIPERDFESVDIRNYSVNKRNNDYLEIDVLYGHPNTTDWSQKEIYCKGGFSTDRFFSNMYVFITDGEINSYKEYADNGSKVIVSGIDNYEEFMDLLNNHIYEEN